MKAIEHFVITFLSGVLLASLLTLSIKYPLPVSAIDKVKPYCSNSTIETIWVGISSDIYTVKCANGIKADVKH